MTAILVHNCIFQIVISSILIFFSCGTNEKIEKINSKNKFSGKSHFEHCYEFNETPSVSMDTIFVETTEVLLSQLGNNKILILGSKKYKLASTLLIDNIENLKIIGIGYSELMISDQNATVLKVLNSQNCSIENITIRHSISKGHSGEQGVLRIEQSSNINILNCKILGAVTFGLVTKDICGLKFENSEITKCTGLIFELDKSKKVEFKNSKFHNNKLAISVLGGFPNSTKEIIFTDCDFVNNQPDISGNPAFNFDNNYQDFEEKIIFRNCTFQNNVGYKWYGKKIKLENCTIDSSDFIGLTNEN